MFVDMVYMVLWNRDGDGCITAILYGQLFETDSYWRHGITIKDGDLVLDIGANIGFYSLSLATQRKNLTILGTLS
jgi:2-polyprenyl-3-methyl-5-hydroxy-6-metoxy-1,4-benzoquinol methylase